ncbi:MULTISPECIES: HDOD domain-containing protein [Thiorhodovibrio]|uniref:HDOD domain-containing protein n=1 Tax=Thiorhodovibrio TaxID=61593 RepID=UPI001913F373|nr:MULTISPECIES: HDOD domain-containing protein [Thiorhodovibrio]MBK5970110.1 histidine kinase [Thiorhodovibrio winogradskyi]WPL13492.1 HDOD domain protein [Thiorhodovibrio litoralis]
MTPEALIKETEHLFSLPDVALRVNQLIDEPSTRPADLAEVILYDAALSARLLRLVNSAYYARPRAIETVTQAISMIGFRPLRDLVIATFAVERFRGLPPERVNMERFWFHGVATGLAARELAKRRGVREGERLFLAGLLHSIGKLVFFSQCAEDYTEVLRLVDEDRQPVVAAEEKVFGFNYAELGAELLRTWRFPESIWKAVAYQLNPDAAPDFKLEAAIVQGAEQVAGIVQSTAIDGGEALATSASDYLSALAERLALSSDALSELPGDISLQVVEVFEILVPGASVVY